MYIHTHAYICMYNYYVATYVSVEDPKKRDMVMYSLYTCTVYVYRTTLLNVIVAIYYHLICNFSPVG